MSIGVLHGQAGGIKLPFRVIGGTTQPSNPKDGTIWVKTSVPITRTEFANGTWASGGVGLTFLAGTLGGSNPTGTNSTVWAINKNTGASKYVLKITLTGCKQVQGSTGNWVNLDAYRYYGGTWVQFSRYNVIPEFTYTGDYEIVNDSDEPITVSQDNWKIRFLTSGTLTFQALNGAENGIDVFLVGGGGAGGASCYVNSENPLWGGGGGGGGYTNTQKEVSVTQGTTYTITVGAGGTGVSGANGNDGGSSSAFGISANGGKGGYAGTTQTNGRKGGAGGSGGGAGGKYSKDTGSSTASGAGGSDGGNGGGSSGGTGQGTTTREFGESTGTLYAGGGGGAKSSSGSNSAGGSGGGTAGNGENASANTGGGGGGGSTPANGGSGIIIIRNKR